MWKASHWYLHCLNDLDDVMSCPFFRILLFFICSIQDDFLSIFRVGSGLEYGNLTSICQRDVCITVASHLKFVYDQAFSW